LKIEKKRLENEHSFSGIGGFLPPTRKTRNLVEQTDISCLRLRKRLCFHPVGLIEFLFALLPAPLLKKGATVGNHLFRGQPLF
jgi:hypothetical protein